MTGQFNPESLRNRLLPPNSFRESGEGPPVAAVAIIINPNDRGGSLLFIKRTERRGDPWSGQIAFPGGRKSPIDKGLAETVVRETLEEVGIQLTGHELLGSLPVVTTRSRRMRVLPFVFQLKSTVNIHVNEEVADAFWVPLSDVEGLEVESREVRVDECILSADSYVVAGRVIWGLTFRIINLLLDRETQSDL
ncbi:MAG: CoA pyrophosphatase [Candidatus Bathyarchaeia archaeon]